MIMSFSVLRSAPVAIALFASVSLVGCNQTAEDPVVTGEITYEGTPVTTGIINFQGEGGRPIGGAIRSDGSYQFRLPPGRYRVRIDSPPSIPADWQEGQPLPELGPRLVPPQFANFETSRLEVNVDDQSGVQELHFHLP